MSRVEIVYDDGTFYVITENEVRVFEGGYKWLPPQLDTYLDEVFGLGKEEFNMTFHMQYKRFLIEILDIHGVRYSVSRKITLSRLIAQGIGC